MNRVQWILRDVSISVARPTGNRWHGNRNGRLRYQRERTTLGFTLGFTLVELLVVVTVLLILTVMTISAIDFTFTSERIRSGTRQVQSALEGARDRAIFSKVEERGLRLLVETGEDRNGNGVLDTGEDLNGNGSLDSGNPRVVTSMIYVRKLAGNWTQGQIRLERPDFEEDANGNGVRDSGENDTNSNGRLDGNGVADSAEIRIVRGSADCGWLTLKERGFLGVFEPDWNNNGILESNEDLNGNGIRDLDTPRIRIPAGNDGQWHVVLTHRLTAADQVLELIPAYKGAGTAQETQVVAFLGTGPATYELELLARVSPDAQPIMLPEGVCIDLDGSDVPSNWRPGPGTALTASYSSHMDIFFSPRGTVSWPPEVAAKGLIHLYLAERKDVTRAVDIGFEVGGTTTPRPPVNNGDAPRVPDVNQFNQDEPIGQRKVITIFTQTGKVSTHDIDPTPKSTPDGTAADPFHYATRGEAQSQ